MPTTRLALLAVALLVLGGAPSARAFTFEDGKGNTIPKFDLEEQARQFRTTPDLDTSAAVKKGMETPFGTLQFGIDRNNSLFGPSSGLRSDNADRRHYERLFAPDSLKNMYD